MKIQIIAKREGFRRCGIEHTSIPTTYDESSFTPEQVAQLKAEPMLVVVELEEKTPTKAEKATAGENKKDSPPAADKKESAPEGEKKDEK